MMMVFPEVAVQLERLRQRCLVIVIEDGQFVDLREATLEEIAAYVPQGTGLGERGKDEQTGQGDGPFSRAG